jgi:threonine/homoserine/homoserine lactone efflux protein
MIGIHDLPLFIGAGLLLNVTPGPDTALVIGQSLLHGRRGGMLAALGVGAGCFVHIGAAAIGLSAVIMTSAVAFLVIKWIGVCYLCYVGARMLFSREHAAIQDVARQSRSSLAIFWLGFLTNVLNPKVALFFLAFLPQFIDVEAPNKAAAFALLGVIVSATGTLWLLVVAFITSMTGARLRADARIKRWLERTLGAMFLALGAKLALSSRN